jgi:CheY-like chemotaxis protein
MMGYHKSKIAVVDDDVRILESIRNLLESAGHSVCSFSSAQSPLEDDILPEIDCLIADIGLPAHRWLRVASAGTRCASRAATTRATAKNVFCIFRDATDAGPDPVKQAAPAGLLSGGFAARYSVRGMRLWRSMSF